MSSVLVAKYYSLGAQLDDSGAMVGVRNERAMINMLDFAEKRAKEIIGLGVAVGADPVGPVISYDAAKIDREGTLDGKFTALQGYWTAALQGQIVGILSGKAAIVLTVSNAHDLPAAEGLLRSHVSEVHVDEGARQLTAPAEGLRDMTRIAAVFEGSQIELDDLGLKRPSLDDVFLSLTGHRAEEAAPTDEELAS